MKIKAKLLKQKINSKVLRDLKKLEGKIKAGYPEEKTASHEEDKNGFSALEKAFKINFTDKNFTPYLQISMQDNIIKYKKSFRAIARSPSKQQDQKINNLGAEMVKDIKQTIINIQHSPATNNKGCIYGAVDFTRSKK